MPNTTTETAPWVVRFVDKPDADRNTRLDLNDEQYGGRVYVRPDGFSLGTSERLVAMVESMLRDGADVAASKRGNRELVIPLTIVADQVADFAAVMNAIAREVDRGRNHLEFQPGEHTGEPVFFVVIQGDVTEVDLDSDDNAPSEWGAQVTLLCEPAAVGAQVTGETTGLGQDPAGGQTLTLPEIRGDLPTPVNIEATWVANQVGASTVLLSRHSTPVGQPSLNRVEQVDNTWTMQPDTSLQAGDPLMSGTGQNHARTTFATDTSLRDRVTKTLAGVPVGSYKAYVRVRKSSAVAEIDFRLSAGAQEVLGPTRRLPGTDQPTQGPAWLDLGLLTVPPGGVTPPGVSTADISVRLQAGRVSGSGSADFDAVRLVPVRDLPDDAPEVDTSWVWHSGDGSAGQSVVLGWDSEHERVYNSVAGELGYLRLRAGPIMLRAHPGWDNHLLLMRHVGTTYDPDGEPVEVDKLGDLTDVTWSFRPRWLYLSEP